MQVRYVVTVSRIFDVNFRILKPILLAPVKFNNQLMKTFVDIFPDNPKLFANMRSCLVRMQVDVL